MVDAGHDIFFSKDRCYAYHRNSKSYIRIVRKSGIFVIEANVRPYKKTNMNGHASR